MPQNPPQQSRFDGTAKANPPLDFDHRNAHTETLLKRGIKIDLDADRHQVMLC
jgi:hypothetical protein